jgi:large conductance mechanosensitive channel
MLKEFRDFIMRGNVLDLAVAFIMGAAFTGIVTSLVNDIIMPPVGLALGGVDFSRLVIPLKAAAGDAPAVTMNIGIFINAIIQFLIVAFVMFLLVRSINHTMKRFEKPVVAVVAEPTTEERLLTAINELTATIRAQKS